MLSQQSQQFLLIYAYVGILGLCMGSFLNVLIARLPKSISILSPPSHCIHCRHSLRWRDNIPLLSYFMLKGQCHFCGIKISYRYPIVEMITCLSSVLVAVKFGLDYKMLFALLFCWSLITLSFIDLEHMILPDAILLPSLWLGLLVNAFHMYQSPDQAILGAALGYLSLWIIYWIFYALTKKEGLGFGDFKLLALLGAWMGWQALPSILLCASLTAAVYGLSLIRFRKKTLSTAIPFGPFLAAAGFLIFIYGNPFERLF